MDSTAFPSLVSPPSSEPQKPEGGLFLDASVLQKQQGLPSVFVWPNEDLVHTQEELNEPLIDLDGFIKGDAEATARAVELVRAACLKHGFFQVTNHGIEMSLIKAAQDEIDKIFSVPLEKKLSVKKTDVVKSEGFSGAHADRYSDKLPWKECFSFVYHENNPDVHHPAVEYFKSSFGAEFESTGYVYV